MWRNLVDVSELIGKTIVEITGDENSDELWFKCSDGSEYKMHHMQDCCEGVYIEDITGDLNNLLNTPILEAREDHSEEDPKAYHDDAYLWTFYNFRTIKGSVTIRWYGESNGYYSVNVDFVKTQEEDKVETNLKGKVLTQEFITRLDVQLHNDSTVYVFGDNMARLGLGGQASYMRNEPNVVGVPTKWFPGNKEGDFFDDEDLDDPLVKARIDGAFHELSELIHQGINVCFPVKKTENGEELSLGLGLAELHLRAPKVKAYIDAWFKALKDYSKGEE
jgi:hypothetical protein